MSRYELTINPTYVPDWGIWEALRELTQNCYDREMVDPEQFTATINYVSAEQKMIFSNAGTTISTSTLLLGTTTKSNQKEAIGQYGEGYKLAMLVLTRLGVRVEIFNGKEVWTPKIIKSRRFDSELLVIDTARSKVKHTDLTFEITGIIPTMYAEFATKCLKVNYPTNILKTDMGNVLLDNNQKGKIYCGGLFVQDAGDEECKYGYDINPSHLQLDRDRKKVDSWNLYWKTSEMFASIRNTEHKELIHQILRDNVPDVRNFHNFCTYRTDELYKSLCEDSYKEFIEKHSVNAVPVKDEDDARMIREKYNNLVPVIIPEKHYIMLTSSEGYKTRVCEEKIDLDISPSAILMDFFEKNKNGMSDDVQENFQKLYEFAKGWKITKYDSIPF